MGELTFWDKVREWIGGVAFRVFLWSCRMTEECYWKHVYELEAERRQQPSDGK